MHSPKPYRICDTKYSIATIGIKTQQLITKCYDLHLLEEARLFRKVDAGLWEIYGGLKEPQGRQGAKSKDGEYLEVEGSF